MTKPPFILIRIVSGLWVVPVAACATRQSTPTPTSAPIPATVADQLARGAPRYAQNCATAKCRGAQGEGIHSGDAFRIWPLVGADFQARNPTAQVIFDVVRSGSEQNLRALTDQQIYDAIAYELSQNGASPAAPLTAANAAQVTVGPSSLTSNLGALFPPPDGVSFAPSSPSLNDSKKVLRF